MSVKNIKRISLNAGKYFYIGEDDKGWKEVVNLTNEIDYLVTNQLINDTALRALLRELRFIEEQKVVSNYPLIADSLYHQIPMIIESK